MPLCHRLCGRTAHHGLVFLAFVVIGCGPAGSEKAQVTGKVLLNQQPITGGTIVLAPVMATGEIAAGEVQSDGTFVLTTVKDNDGAPLGKSRISYKPPIVAFEPPEDWDSSRGDPPHEKSPYEGLVPKQNEVEVKPGSNTITIELIPDAQLARDGGA